MIKRILTTLLILAMIFSLAACGGGEKSEDQTKQEEMKEEKSENLLETEQVKIEAVCVDDSYTDDEGSSRRAVYLFYTVSPKGNNVRVYDSSIDLIVDGGNTYESGGHSLCEDIPDYYYSSYIKNVYVGETQKAVTTFLIPEAELEAGKKLTLSNTEIEDMGEIYFMSDIIEHYDSEAAISEAVDPEGYAAEMKAREPADADTTATIKGYIDGYQWDFICLNMAHQIEFFSDNTYELRTTFGATSGTYQVANGYVICTNDSTGAVTRIPYTIENNDINLDVITGFDVKAD